MIKNKTILLTDYTATFKCDRAVGLVIDRILNEKDEKYIFSY